MKGRHIEAIIGCKYLSLFEPCSNESIYKRKNIDEPVAKKTPLGWVVVGKTSTTIQGNAMNISGKFAGFAIPAKGIIGDELSPDYKQLYHQLKRDMNRAWNLETEEEMRCLVSKCYSPAPCTIAEERADVILQETSAFTKMNKNKVGLIWKSNLRPPNNYAAAEQMFLNLEKELQINEEKKRASHQMHQEWLSSGYLHPVDRNSDEKDQFFLPGFMVERETTHDKTFRYVMNGAKQFQGQSLNDYLLPRKNK